jgi:UDP-N-acetylmuramate--alanine ligase
VALDDPGAARVAAGAGGPEAGVVTYGTAPGAAYRVGDVQLGRMGASFGLSGEGAGPGRFELALPGLHNVLNAAGALAMAFSLGVAPEDAARGLAAYRSVARRFELRGRRDGVTFVDDYAHNPGKVGAVLAGARAGGWDRVVAVFQPHRFTRTAALWREFGPAFAQADVVVLTDIYPAGEPPQPGVDGRLVLDAVRRANPGLPVEYAPSRAELASVVRRLLRPGDLCLTMGAGDITSLADELLGSAQPVEVAR